MLPKFAKELWFLGFLFVSILMLGIPGVLRSIIGLPKPALAFTALVALGWLTSFFYFGSLFALVGLRSYEFMVIAIVGGWAAGGMRMLSRVLCVLILVQCALVALEFVIGIPLRSCPNSFRAIGSFVIPSTLGIVAVISLALILEVEARREVAAVMTLATMFLLVASGSATGMVALFIVFAWHLVHQLPARWRVRAGLAICALLLGLLVALPTMLHRADLYDSILGSGGRFDKMEYARSMIDGPMEAAVGRGVGTASNTYSNMWHSQVAYTGEQGFYLPETYYTDSTITLMFAQLGWTGVLAFYLMIAWAMYRDRRMRSVYAVIVLCSLTINFIEVFPANFLLGLLLARSFHLHALTRARLA